uniref:Arp2/3 complex 41 kDa subunit n=1 Tax=Timema poppense TaxID=170557 RepID=A0A7R9D7A6_TIMPO|nr:unnamed protein product [Timema poppensis]
MRLEKERMQKRMMEMKYTQVAILIILLRRSYDRRYTGLVGQHPVLQQEALHILRKEISAQLLAHADKVPDESTTLDRLVLLVHGIQELLSVFQINHLAELGQRVQLGHHLLHAFFLVLQEEFVIEHFVKVVDGARRGGELALVGAAFYDSSINYGQSYRLQSDTSIFTAELFAMLQALKYILSLRPQPVVVLCHSRIALESISGLSSPPSQPLIIQILEKSAYLRARGYELGYQWIPSYVDIMGRVKGTRLRPGHAYTKDRVYLMRKVPSAHCVEIPLPYSNFTPRLKFRIQDIWGECQQKAYWYHEIVTTCFGAAMAPSSGLKKDPEMSSYYDKSNSSIDLSSQVALSPNNHEVHIYQRSDNDWKLLDVLNQHDLRVTSIDWAPKTNRIVTCAVDRNAYVWSLGDDHKWKPTLVLLRINRAATCVKWSPLENKFAVGCGARLISVCYFESENDWWVSKHIKKPIRSTITTIDWHPNNVLLVRIFSAFIKAIEEMPQPSPWGMKMSMGVMLAEFPNSTNGGGWVHSVAFSGDGNRLCWVGHDSSVSVADANRQSSVTRLKTEFLPFLSCVWVGNNSFVAAGHSCCPMLYSVNEAGQLYLNSKLDMSQKKEAGGLSAMRKFQSLDRQARIEINDTTLETVHQNAITSLCLYEGTKGAASKVSTSGLDGQLVIWDLRSLEESIQGMKIV